MRKTALLSLLFCAVSLVFTSCSDDESLKFHPNIQAYTSGTISRYAPVSISFTEQLPSDKQRAEFLEKNIKISPSADVEFSVSDNYIVTFVPKSSFERDTEYKVTIKMDKFIDGLDSDLDRFTFRFKTMPLLCHGEFGPLEVSEDDIHYGSTFTLVTADNETSSDAESLVSFSGVTNIKWNHDATGRIHKAVLSGIEAGDTTKTVEFKLKNSGEYPSEGTLTIPGRNDFSLYDIVVREGSERCVSIYFTKNLDMEQDITGLAYIDGNTNELMQIEGNCVKVYYDEKLKGSVNIFVNKGIKSSKGLTLSESQTFQCTIGDAAKPSLAFVSQGAILPLSSNLTVQFKSTYLKGVIVRVIEVPQYNMGQFLQSSNLEGDGEMRRVGRLINQDILFLDEDPTIDLTEPHIFSINLSKLFTANPGSLYRVELSTYSGMSLYPCDGSLSEDKEELKAKFAQRFAEERLALEGDGYYYYFSNGDPSSWWDNGEPCKASFYDDIKAAKNVVATNLGVTVKCGADRNINVWVNNLIDTEAEGGVDIMVYNFQHGLTAEGRTNADGFASIPYTNGKPYYLIAKKGIDVAYLRIDDGSSLSLSDFDTEGTLLQEGLNGFIYGERGVWRPGDTLHIGFMLGDRATALPKEHPVVLELSNPLGQIYARRTLSKGALGVYAFNIALAPDVPTGMWAAKINVGGATFTKYLRVETIMPNRLKVSPDFGTDIINRGENVNGKLHTEWLNGAAARNYKYDIQAQFVSAATTFKAYKDYSFSPAGMRYTSEESALITGVTDAEGDANLNFSLNGGAKAPGMLSAIITTKVYEPSGQFSIDVTKKHYSPYKTYVGVATPNSGKDALPTDQTHTFKMVSVDANGNPAGGKSLSVKVYKVGWYWWWNSDDSYLADFVSDTYNQPILTDTYRTDKAGNARLDFNCPKKDWGTYLICVKDLESGHTASTLAYFDWPGNPERYGNATAATRLAFKTDKDTYKVGEKIKFSIPSVEGAKALVTVENGSRVLDTKIIKCNKESTQVEIPVTAQMRPNVYVYVSLIQPYAQSVNDLPMRLYGVAAVTVNDPDSHLTPLIDVKDEVLPNSDFTVTVSEKSGKEMAYTIAIVDEGLLDLTHFKTPDPWESFNAREALGVRTWDAYNMVIGAYGGRIEQMFSIGGDEDAMAGGAKALVNRFTPVVIYAGPFQLKSGSKKHTFRMPNYNGKVRVMVVAGNGDAYGSADKSILVRQPVMVIGTMPRVVGQGEEITIPATVFATKDNVGKVNVSIECTGGLTVVGESKITTSFAKIGDKSVSFKIKAGNTPGTGVVSIVAKSGSCESLYKAELAVRSVADETTQYKDITVAAGEEWQGSVNAIGLAGTNSLSVTLSGVRPINIAARQGYLTEYPHSCVEQLVSRAFPLQDESTVKFVLSKLSSYQVFDGSLAYWPGSSNTNIWGTIYAAHFIAYAEKAGYSIPVTFKSKLLKYLRLSASGWKLSAVADDYTKANEITTQAYRLYVLGLNGSSDIGSLNRLKEEANTSLSKWLVAGAYALAGRRDMSERFINATSEYEMNYEGANPTFGSEMRDNALILQVLSILDHKADAAAVYNSLAANLSSERWYSTQDVALALSSALQYQKKYGKPEPAKGSILYGSQSEKFNTTTELSKSLATDVDAFEKIVIKNRGSQPLYVRLTSKGTVPGSQSEAQSSGVGVAVSYTDSDFSPLDVSSLIQGTNFMSTVTVRNNSPLDISNLAVTHIIPSGWEILNTRYAVEGQEPAQSAVSYQDVRDDRVLSYIDILPAGKQVTLAIKLTASYLGTYMLPSIKCEAMYNAQISARTAASNCEVVGSKE